MPNDYYDGLDCNSQRGNVRGRHLHRDCRKDTGGARREGNVGEGDDGQWKLVVGLQPSETADRVSDSSTVTLPMSHTRHR